MVDSPRTAARAILALNSGENLRGFAMMMPPDHQLIPTLHRAQFLGRSTSPTCRRGGEAGVPPVSRRGVVGGERDRGVHARRPVAGGPVADTKEITADLRGDSCEMAGGIFSAGGSTGASAKNRLAGNLDRTKNETGKERRWLGSNVPFV
jgi:hypothetical protein